MGEGWEGAGREDFTLLLMMSFASKGDALYVLFFFLIYFLFLAALGLCCCAQAFSSCDERGLLFVAVRRLLTLVASFVVERGL